MDYLGIKRYVPLRKTFVTLMFFVVEGFFQDNEPGKRGWFWLFAVLNVRHV